MDRRYVLGGIAVLTALVAAYLLRRVVATVFFALTVAYVLAPVYDWFTRRGVSSWFASAAASVVGLLGLVVALSPILVVLNFREDEAIELINTLPDTVTIPIPGDPVELTSAEVTDLATDTVLQVAENFALAAPGLAIKLAVFLLVVFAMLMERDEVHDATMAVVPRNYRSVVAALADRARETLFAIYVLQAATAVVAFVLSLPVFYVLGYEYPFTLSVVAGVLQFLPIVGPSVLLLAIAGIDLALGATAFGFPRAALVLVVGGIVIAWLPDPLVRPRLARATADLPGTLYFVGFTGGLLTIGVVGVIAGPLVVALVAESVDLLAEEMRIRSAVEADELTDHAAAEGIDPGTPTQRVPDPWTPDDRDLSAVPDAEDGPAADDVGPGVGPGDGADAAGSGEGSTDAP